MPKAKMTLWSTDWCGWDFGSHGVIVWPGSALCDEKHSKCIHCTAIKSRRFAHLHDVWIIFQKYPEWNAPNHVRNNAAWKMIELREAWEAVCHLVYCIWVSSSIKTVAHLLIRADVPANHSDVEETKIKTALAKRQSQAFWMNLKWCVKTGNSS